MRLLQLTGGHESIDISWLLGPQQQTCGSGWMGSMDRHCIITVDWLS